MPLPDFAADGVLPPGIHAASLPEVGDRYGQGALVRQQEFELLRRVVEAALDYPTIKRILLWGSVVTDRSDPQDLDYSLYWSVNHHMNGNATAQRRHLIYA